MQIFSLNRSTRRLARMGALAALLASFWVDAGTGLGAAMDAPAPSSATGSAAFLQQTAAKLLATGRADQSLATLNQLLQQNAKDAEALNLQCRVYFTEQMLDEAQNACESAVAAAPQTSDYHLWLARVLGTRAQHASVLSAYSLAKRVHTEFESAHQLSPRSEPAAGDLAEFYVKAPHMLGGGREKAEALAGEVAPWNPSLAHTIRAQVAESAKDDATAEAELKAAASSRGAKPQEFVALASFYRKQSRSPEMLSAIDRAVAMDTAHDDALVSASEQLTKSGQRPDQAIALLRSYLASANQSEDAPSFRVRAQLASLLKKSGDQAGAERELVAAQSLASGWKPRRHQDAGD